MKNKKYLLVNYLNESKKYPEESPIPESEELNKLKENDFVFLIFRAEDKEERMWVKITEIVDNPRSYKGVLANEPAILTGITQGETVIFDQAHIANYSTKEEQDRIIREFNETGLLPLIEKNVSFGELEKVINELVGIPEEFEDGFQMLYKIKRIGRIFFKKNLTEITQDHAKAISRNKVIERMLTEDLIKLFLSLILVIILPQISESLDSGKVEYSEHAKVYYKRLQEVLEETALIYKKIAATRGNLLSEIRRFYNDNELNRLPEDQLPQLFAVFIEETIDALSQLA